MSFAFLSSNLGRLFLFGPHSDSCKAEDTAKKEFLIETSIVVQVCEFTTQDSLYAKASSACVSSPTSQDYPSSATNSIQEISKEAVVCSMVSAMGFGVRLLIQKSDRNCLTLREC